MFFFLFNQTTYLWERQVNNNHKHQNCTRVCGVDLMLHFLFCGCEPLCILNKLWIWNLLWHHYRKWLTHELPTNPVWSADSLQSRKHFILLMTLESWLLRAQIWVRKGSISSQTDVIQLGWEKHGAGSGERFVTLTNHWPLGLKPSSQKTLGKIIQKMYPHFFTTVSAER